MPCVSVVLQVTLSIELNDAQLDEFESMIPILLAQPPWNYTLPLSKGITVDVVLHHSQKFQKIHQIVTMLIRFRTKRKQTFPNYCSDSTQRFSDSFCYNCYWNNFNLRKTISISVLISISIWITTSDAWLLAISMRAEATYCTPWAIKTLPLLFLQ